MIRLPLILISPNIEKKGDEFGDLSTSLSETYQQALMGAGGIPLALRFLAVLILVAEIALFHRPRELIVLWGLLAPIGGTGARMLSMSLAR